MPITDHFFKKVFLKHKYADLTPKHPSVHSFIPKHFYSISTVEVSIVEWSDSPVYV